MDHISANKTLTIQERENISGARVFDGEDQGKLKFPICYSSQGNPTKQNL